MVELYSRGAIFAWSSIKVICLIVFGVVVGGYFLLNEAKVAKYPVMQLYLFNRKQNVATLLVAFLHGLVSF